MSVLSWLALLARSQTSKNAEILVLRQEVKSAGIDPAPRRGSVTWASFLRSQAEGIVACDFFIADLLDGTKVYVLAVIEHATRRIRILGSTLHPAGEWTAQMARNLVMDLEDQSVKVKFLIRDRGSNFTAAFDTVLADASMSTVLCNVRTPRMNERDHGELGRFGPPRTPEPHPGLEPRTPAPDPA